MSWTEIRVVSIPHLMYEVRVRFCDLSMHSQRVVVVDLVFVIVSQEVFCDLWCIAQTLKGGIHEACVTKVTQTTQPRVDRQLARARTIIHRRRLLDAGRMGDAARWRIESERKSLEYVVN